MWAQKRQYGFTIVELLIVIVVIGILAAITITAYNGIQQRARVSSVTESLAQAKKKLLLYQVDNGNFPASGSLSAAGITDGGNVTYQYTGGDTTFCLTATNSNVSYKITDLTTPQSGGCAGHSQGGVAAITNLAIDPSAVSNPSNFALMGSGYATFTSSIASDQAHHGSTSLKRSITGAGTIASKTMFPAVRLNAGEQLSWSFWAYSTRAGTLNMYAEGSKVADGSYAGCGGSGSGPIAANTWTKFQGTCSPGVDINVTGAGGYGLAVQAGDSVWFDEYMVTKTSSVQNYADGTTTDWTWNGSANNSTSTGPPV